MSRSTAFVPLVALVCATAPCAAQELSAGARQALLDPREQLPEAARIELTDAWEAWVTPALDDAFEEPYEVEALGVSAEQLGGSLRIVFRARTSASTAEAPDVNTSTVELCFVVSPEGLDAGDVFSLSAEPSESVRVGETSAAEWRERFKRSHQIAGEVEPRPMWISRHTLVWGGEGLWLRAQHTQGFLKRFVRSDARGMGARLSEHQEQLARFVREVERPPLVTLLEASPALTGVPIERLDATALAALNLERQAVAADGVSRLVLRVDVPTPGVVRLKLRRGQLEPLLGGRTTPRGEEHTAYALYTAPDGGDLSRLLRLRIEFAPDDGGPPRQNESRLRLAAPPVILVHGLGEQPEVLWGPLVARLRDTAKLPVFLLDLTGVEGGPEAVQRALWDGPGDGLRAGLDALREAGVAVTRGDVVTHGAGAWVARAWVEGHRYRRVANDGAGDLRRLITLSAPHRGSDLARAFEAVRGLEVAGRPFAELAGESPWLAPWVTRPAWVQALARTPAVVEAEVATHALVGVAREQDLLADQALGQRAWLTIARGLATDPERLAGLLESVGQATRLDGLRAQLAAFQGWEDPAAPEARALVAALRAALCGGTQNDGAVRVESQWGGLEPPWVSSFTGVVHGRAPADPRVVERVHTLLIGDGGAFAPGLPASEAPLQNVVPR